MSLHSHPAAAPTKEQTMPRSSLPDRCGLLFLCGRGSGNGATETTTAQHYHDNRCVCGVSGAIDDPSPSPSPHPAVIEQGQGAVVVLILQSAVAILGMNVSLYILNYHSSSLSSFPKTKPVVPISPPSSSLTSSSSSTSKLLGLQRGEARFCISFHQTWRSATALGIF